MVQTVREQILANVRTTLLGIDGTGSYFSTIPVVTRINEAGPNAASFPRIVIGEPDEQIGEHGAQFVTKATMNLTLAVWDRVASSTAGTRISELIADVQRAMAQDIKRGGLAQWTYAREVIPIEMAVAESVGVVGVLMRFEILYRYKTQDPNTVQT